MDRVCFGDLDHDNQDEVIVSWGSVQSLYSILSVYDYHDNVVDEYNLDRPYGEFAVTDLDGDGQSELFVAEVRTTSSTKTENTFNTTQSQSALALLYRLRNNRLKLYGRRVGPECHALYPAERVADGAGAVGQHGGARRGAR